MEKPSRLASLDALRGFDMLWIIGGSHLVEDLAKANNNPIFNARQCKWSISNGKDFIFTI